MSRSLPVMVYLSFVAAVGVLFLVCGWEQTWTLLRIPTMSPPFTDMRTIQGAVRVAVRGISPQLANPGDPWGRAMNYPSAWIHIGRLLRFANDQCFLAFCTASALNFIGICTYLLRRFPSVWLLACALSSAPLLALERGNNDLHAFILLFAFTVLTSWVAVIPFFLAILLKVYPAAALFLAAVKRDARRLLLFVAGATAAVVLLKDQLQTIRAGNTAHGALAYGWDNSLGFLHRLGALNALDPLVTKLGVALVTTAAVLTLAMKLVPRPLEDALDTHLFWVGSAIYTSTYLLATNWDYRLIFLLFCIPLLTHQSLGALAAALRPLILVALNAPWLKQLGPVFVVVNQADKFALFVVLAAGMIAALARQHAANGGRRGQA